MQESAANNWQRKEVPLTVEADSSNPSTVKDYGRWPGGGALHMGIFSGLLTVLLTSKQRNSSPSGSLPSGRVLHTNALSCRITI